VTYPHLTLAGWRWKSAVALSALLLYALALVASHTPDPVFGRLIPERAAHGATAPNLAEVALATPQRPVEVIVQFQRGVPAARGAAAIRAAGGRVTRDLHIINGVGARMPASAALKLRGQDGVRGVTLNSSVASADDAVTVGTSDDGTGDVVNPDYFNTAYVQSVRATALWRDRENVGIKAKGTSVGVAVIDTGIAGDLPDFQVSRRDTTSRVIASAVVNPEATSAGDGYGHGTHIAGLIAGNGNARLKTDPLRGRYVGVAPDANLISVKVANEAGESSLLDVIYGIQFAVDNKSQFGIRVINLSLNAEVAESYTTDPLDAAAEAAWFSGLVVVAAAGNRGTDADAVNYSPGNDPYVISVGAVDDQGTKAITDDVMADWSSRGTTQDGFTKPGVLAPGAHLISTLAPGSAFAQQCPECVVDGQYFRVGGTSMSAAVVSGVAALLIQLHPDWTPNQVKGALKNRARTIPGVGGEVDALGAFKATGDQLISNTGLTPNTLIDPATGSVDPTRARWSRARWSEAVDPLRARWSAASFTCSCDPEADQTVADATDPTRARWSRARWSRARWSTSYVK
jgi:serine protease AprX